MKRLLGIVFLFCVCVSLAHAKSTIFIVRHAEKADDQSKDPELSRAGRARADMLAKMLKSSGISAIYATEFKRTQQTAAPLAAVLQLKTTIVPAKDVAGLASKLREGNQSALVVGHGNTIPSLIEALGIEKEIEIRESEYDNLFFVVLGEEPYLVRLHY